MPVFKPQQLSSDNQDKLANLKKFLASLQMPKEAIQMPEALGSISSKFNFNYAKLKFLAALSLKRPAESADLHVSHPSIECPPTKRLCLGSGILKQRSDYDNQRMTQTSKNSNSSNKKGFTPLTKKADLTDRQASPMAPGGNS